MLYICATPIGNLEDITLRVLKTLKEVDYIACEDTRRTLKLLNHFEIRNKLISLNEHNEFSKKEGIIQDLVDGKNVALVSDAGMPGIQDPGRLLILEAIKSNIPYTVLPGASAAITALVGSGLGQDEFVFLGFLPRKKSERMNVLQKYLPLNREIILYEAPHRFAKLLEDIHQVFGNRNLVIVREISKKFEEYIHTNAEEALEKHSQIKGEIVLIIQRGKDVQAKEYTDQEIMAFAREYFAQGENTKDIVKQLVSEKGIPKNLAYELTLKVTR